MLALAVAAAILAESALMRAGLSAVLSAEPGVRVTQAVRAEDAASLNGDELDLVVHDVPDELSPEEALARTPRDIPVLALVGDRERTRALLRAGAQGVVSRDAPSSELTAATLAVGSGLAVLDADALAALMAPVAPTEPTPLSAREREVLELVADGLSNKLIAERLGVSEHTAKFHVRSLLDKLGADTRADAVARAARRGLLAL